MTNHPIKLRNSASGSNKPEPFIPLDWQVDGIPEDRKRVRMYVCGPTVYDRAHIGNARPAVVFDVLYRLLKHVYNGRVTYVRNITDIDDKINNRAKETLREGETPVEAIRRISNETMRWYQEDMRALGCLDPDEQPRATDYVEQMKAMISKLIADGFAYEVEGHVLFEVAKYKDYGTLSNRSIDEMITSVRGETAPNKRAPMDFVLWKPSAEGQPGWESPWGRGRPGWHIECSAMAGELLGETFDIHGGGADLMFPHHENEIAQSRCACPEGGFARVWMHNGMIRVDGQKMSKSLGNFTTVEDLRYQMDGEFIRYALLSIQYSKELDWNYHKEEEAERTIRKWYSIVGDIQPNRFAGASNAERWGVIDALANDLNSRLAFRRLETLAEIAARSEEEAHRRALKEAAMFLGFLTRTETEFKKSLFERQNAFDVEFVKNVLRARTEARERRDYAKADALRDGLIAAGVRLKDLPEGTTFELSTKFDHDRLSEIDI